ncbi:MAG: hypothetical protein U0943_12090 [Brevundimonas sp.]|nr:hypothetical protein [Brevundimonas sp.]
MPKKSRTEAPAGLSASAGQPLIDAPDLLEVKGAPVHPYQTALPFEFSLHDGDRSSKRSDMSTEGQTEEFTATDEIAFDLKRLTMRARGRGLRQVPLLAGVLLVAMLISLAMVLGMVHLAARQSPPVVSLIERTISRL